ncbi:ATP-binding protein [Granulicella mallensis]|uniref:histidine kinase n=1 Tax=Granulicella mallensis (strain ATCC BAA-1857 / DSM 23137 / MP5ACTX8) TaxID=682795 RepID=G8NP55_GRAMM|nr:ATP-binding protein [Granulicella mallensis]AEU38254.1 histidine kinase [Granulicella mallensis MP5ACTX8]
MDETFKFPLLTIPLRHDRHVVQARQRARDVAALLGFEHQDQIRLATAASELARNAFRYAESGAVDFSVTNADPQVFVISVTDKGAGIPNLTEILDGRYVSKTGLGMGLIGTKRLMDHFHIASDSTGTRVECGKALPATAPAVNAASIKAISAKLAGGSAADPFDEIERQNQELLKTLAELKEKQDQLADLNQELEDTNRGVVALYAELEQHADDLRKVSDLKTSFLSNLSHEFRTPLNSISSLSRLLLGRTDGELSEEQEKQVTYIQHSASELSELVNDLLDLAKVEAGKIDVKPRHFEVNDFFGALRGMLKPLLAGNSLELIFDAAADLPTLYTDEGKVSQILRNLIANALKFTRKGHIRVTAEIEDGGWVAFRVADTGIGILPEDQERIFEEFTQIEGEMQSQVKGTGLGLPLSRRLAELLGGSLNVESESGQGSTFTARIPAHFGKTEIEPLAPLLNQEATGAPILFIEDNRETSFVHQSSLKNSNYRTVFVANIPESRAAMKQMSPSLVVLDRLIDQKDCLYYIEELRSQGYSGPILVVSVVDDAKSAIEAGADAFLAKPVPPFSLLNVVRELIEGAPSKTILLVDDDEVTRYLVGGALAKVGYRILEAHGGREALRLIKDEVPDAVVLDIAMPDMNGFEVLREIRKSLASKAIPVIVHSSRELSNQDRKLLLDSFTFFYPKQAFSGEGGPRGLLQVLESTGIGL